MEISSLNRVVSSAPCCGQGSLRTENAGSETENATENAAETTEESPDRLTLSSAQPPQQPGQAPVDAEILREVNDLKARDRQVRAHEAAHLGAAGRYANGGPTYTLRRGPDGRNYAVGGEVRIDTSPVPGDPQATLDKARIVRAAALAPADPSLQDRRVAAEAARLAAQAQAEILSQRLNELSKGKDEKGQNVDLQA